LFFFYLAAGDAWLLRQYAFFASKSSTATSSFISSPAFKPSGDQLMLISVSASGASEAS
jgi:hypothetical protein